MTGSSKLLRNAAIGTVIAVLGLGLVPTAASAVTNVASVTDSTGTTEYSTLPDAVDAAEDGATITMLADTTLTRAVWFDDDRTLTVELEGKKITTNGNHALNAIGVDVTINGPGVIQVTNPAGDGAFYLKGTAAEVENYTVVNINNGVTMDGWPAIFIEHTTDSGADSDNGIVANLNAVTMNSYYYGMYISGLIRADRTAHVPVLNITGSTFNVGVDDDPCPAMYLAGSGTTTIVDSTINAGNAGNSGIELRAGSLEVTNTTINAGSEAPEVRPNLSGTTSHNIGIAVAQHTTRQDINVTVNGGSYAGGAAVYVANPQDNTPFDNVNVTVNGGQFTGEMLSTNAVGAPLTKFINGGSFTDDVAASNLVADGKAVLAHSASALFQFDVLTPEEARERAAAFVTNNGITIYYDSLEDAQAAVDADGGVLTRLFSVGFNPDNGDPVTSLIVDGGTAVAEPADPTKAGYTFDGWYNGTSAWTFTTPVTESMVLTAGWTRIPVPPVAPTGVTVKGAALQALVSWPAVDGATSYKVVLTQGTNTVTCTTDTLSCAFVNLTAGSVSATVTARNADGDSPASAAATGTVSASTPPPATPPANSGGSVVDSAPASAPAGGEAITVVLSGFAPGSLVNLYVYSSPILLGSAIADGNGVATFSVKIPAGLSAGTHTLVGSGINSAGDPTTVSQTITITADSNGGNGGNGGKDSNGGKDGLAATGLPVEQTTNMALLGLVLLAFGGIAVAVRRRKATTK